jgi:sporulation related protein
MANIRGTYEPPGEDVHIFDAAEEDDDAEGSRLPLLIVIALFVIAAFGGVVWLAYTQGVARGHSETARLIAAPQGPAKVAANGTENSGGSPYKGLKIYQQPAPADEQADHQVTPPPAETAPSTTVVTPSSPPADTTAPAATPPAQTQPKAPLPTAAAAPKPKAPPPPAIRATPQQTAGDGAVPIDQTTAAVHLTPPAATSSPPAAPKPAVAAPKTGGAYVLQIGAYKSADEANAAWKTYHAKHVSLLGDDTPDVLKVDLGVKGTWFRLRTGSFSDKAGAQAFCAKLSAEGGACFPAK